MTRDLILECTLCKNIIKVPLNQFKDGGIGINKFKCIFCCSNLIPTDIYFEEF